MLLTELFSFFISLLFPLRSLFENLREKDCTNYTNCKRASIFKKLFHLSRLSPHIGEGYLYLHLLYQIMSQNHAITTVLQLCNHFLNFFSGVFPISFIPLLLKKLHKPLFPGLCQYSLLSAVSIINLMVPDVFKNAEPYF